MADALAKLGPDATDFGNTHIFWHPPLIVADLVQEDLLGITTVRTTNINFINLACRDVATNLNNVNDTS